ncbi:MAG: ABC transporter ATP-binding protein [Clostridia bacterium]|nr:ABC transporter ATP-binding protein [Clostridia bacterium]
MDEVFDLEENAENVLVARDLKKTFKLSRKQKKLEKSVTGLKTAVDGLSFAARRGEIYGLLGPNGAGKTTTLRMLATLIKPDEGDAEVNGYSVLKEPDKARSKLGFLTSELKPDEFFTPNYMFDFFSALHGVSEADREKRKLDLFTRFGIGEFAETKIADLSTGMKQKVSIAISLVHDPEFIIFDEPTNGLDVLTAKAVTDFLLELKQRGKTILLSTHIFSLVEKICDRVGVIIDGKMSLEGNVKELTKEKNLEEVFFDLYAARKGGKE